MIKVAQNSFFHFFKILRKTTHILVTDTLLSFSWLNRLA